MGPTGLADAAMGPAWRYEAAVRQAEAETEASLADAIKANRWRLDRIAVTENAREFNAGRFETVSESVDRAEVERRTGLKLVAYWDALLDACEQCNWLDGKPEDKWGGDRPGATHPGCRCTYHLVLE